MTTFRLVCAGCGTPAPALAVEPFPFRCRGAGASPGADHVVARVLDEGHLDWPENREDNPFIRYRTLLYSWHVAQALRIADDDYVALAENLDRQVAAACGQRFKVTPCGRNGPLSDALGFSAEGGAWVKDETGNVSGSHKARHLAGIMLYLQVLERAGRVRRRPELAIASCGNAALAAAVVARAAEWPLRAFIPPDANTVVVERLRELGAALTVCERQAGEAGDPCYARFREAVFTGALPFCCQGPDNGLTIEGGETLAYETIDAPGGDALDALVIQVGGGALASACVQGFSRASALGRLVRVPKIYTVQTERAAPLARAYEGVAARAARTGIDEALAYAAAHRSEFMWPWETVPHSIAHGILDDETYDWLAVVEGMLQTGGRAIVVDEAGLEDANRQARETTGVNVDHTGSAGLAGLRVLRARGDIHPNARAGIIFSGVQRG